jgi:hypothetical protein
MPLLYQSLSSTKKIWYVSVLAGIVAINLLTLFIGWQRQIQANAPPVPLYMILISFIVQLPYILEIITTLLKKKSSALGLYLVIMAMNLLVGLSLLFFILSSFFASKIAFGSLFMVGLLGSMQLAFVFAGRGFPLLILLQPLILWLLTPLIPQFLYRTTRSERVHESTIRSKLKIQRKIWVHPDINNSFSFVVFSVAVALYALIGLFFYTFSPSLWVPADSTLWDSWMF